VRSLLFGSAMLLTALALCGNVQAGPAPLKHPHLMRSVYQELVEINTVTDVGDTARAADAMAARLLAAGFPKDDVQVFKPVPRKGNLVARLRGNGTQKPLLLVAHLDVVAAHREDWSTDPFKLIEKDGFFYGRGTSDDKFMAASLLVNLIRMKEEGVVLSRDLILVLDTDEETGDRQGHGIQWLLEHQRPLLDAEFALNEGGTVVGLRGKPLFFAVQTAEKLRVSYRLEVRNRGGHSSVPRKDNAIYQLAQALGRIERFEFPVTLNEVTRVSLELGSVLQPAQIGEGMRAIARGTADADAISRVAADPALNANLRTTCVPTTIEGGHADNALPQKAAATVDCRVLPGETAEQTLATLRQLVADDQVAVTMVWSGAPSQPSPLTESITSVMKEVAREFWPQVPVVPLMSPGGSDAAYLRNAGIPTYGFDGRLMDLTDIREHGKDERVSLSEYHQGHEVFYRLIRLLAMPTG
jgi:acetylornithine deacetylase/succinyl-diaminopimelate desuccinylase-like protein